MTNSLEKHNDEIDLGLFLKTLFRNKILISSISLTAFIIGCLYSLTLKRVWEGQFQIVLNTKKGPNQFNNPFPLAPNNNNDLATEVQKLKSPSVLMPIFEFAQSIENNNLSNYSGFSKWKENLDIQLIKNTSVLNIAYRDKNKEKILPILEKMSEAYQEYTDIGKKRSTKLQIDYVEKQVSLYKEKSANSLRIAQEYAIKEDLMYYDMNLAGTNIYRKEDSLPSANLILPNINIENIRVVAANEIRRINIQIEKINSIDDYEGLMGFGSTIPDLGEGNLQSKLETIDEDLALLRSKYTEEDPSIKKLLTEKNQLIKLLKQRTINYLIATKSQAEARMESAIRNKGVLMKYKELIREAARDENTLVILEAQLRKLELEAAKKEEPWELITKPTLLDFPVAPSRKSIGLTSLIIGIIIGSAYASSREKNSGIIYDSEVLKKIIPTKIISKIDLKDSYKKDKEFSFLKDYLEINSTSSISFLLLEGIDSKDLESFRREFKKNKLNFYKNLNDIEVDRMENSTYLILKLGASKKSEILNIIKLNESLKNEFKGIIIFQDQNPESFESLYNEFSFKIKLIFNYLSNKIYKYNSIKTLSKKIGSKSQTIFNNISDFLSKFLK